MAITQTLPSLTKETLTPSSLSTNPLFTESVSQSDAFLRSMTGNYTIMRLRFHDSFDSPQASLCLDPPDTSMNKLRCFTLVIFPKLFSPVLLHSCISCPRNQYGF